MPSFMCFSALSACPRPTWPGTAAPCINQTALFVPVQKQPAMSHKLPSLFTNSHSLRFAVNCWGIGKACVFFLCMEGVLYFVCVFDFGCWRLLCDVDAEYKILKNSKGSRRQYFCCGENQTFNEKPPSDSCMRDIMEFSDTYKM